MLETREIFLKRVKKENLETNKISSLMEPFVRQMLTAILNHFKLRFKKIYFDFISYEKEKKLYDMLEYSENEYVNESKKIEIFIKEKYDHDVL